MNKIGVVVSSPICKTDRIKSSDLIVGEILMTLYIGDEEFNSHTITQSELFRRMREEDVMPKTAQPSPGDVENVLNDALTKVEKLIVVLPHSSLSGTYQNVVLAAKENKRCDDIFVIASNSVAISETAVVHEALDLIEKGIEFDTLCDELIKFNDRLITYAYPGSTKHLRKSGRITNGQALILGALHIRVQIKCAGDAPFSNGKGRGEKFVLKNIEEELANVTVEHIYYTSLAESPKLKQAILKMFDSKGYEYTVTDDADAIPCVHFGENTLGMTVVCK